MGKVLILLTLMAFAAANDVLKYEPSQKVVATTGTSTGSPKFCNNIGCPKFVVVDSNERYEERRYMKASWVSTNILDMDYSQASYTMFMKLFRYIKGNNLKKQPIAMTVPVKRRVIPGQGPAGESNFTMSFFVDPSEGVPPAPSNKEVFIENMKPMTVYVKVFGGFARNYADWREKALELGAALKADGHDFVADYYYTCGYDAPFKLFNRHNEIWFIKK